MYDKKINECYKLAKEFLDANFLRELEIQESRIARESELVLACELMKKKYKFQKRPQSEGPDFLLEYQNKKVWIEVVAPKEGVYPVLKNQAILDNGSVLGQIDDIICKLKIGSVIKDKKDKYQEWKEKGIVNDEDVKIICLNVYNLHSGPSLCPYAASVVYGIDYAVYADTESSSIEWESHLPLRKTSGSEVEIGLFRQQDYDNIDGVLWFNYFFGRGGDCEIQFLANFNRKERIGSLFSNLNICVIPLDE